MMPTAGTGGQVRMKNIHHAPWPVVSAGHLIKQDKSGVTLAQCVTSGDYSLGGILFIPNSMIARVQKVPYNFGVR